MRTLLIIISFALLTLLSLQTHAQGTQTTFGKNRVQYDQLEWSYIETDNFFTYHYIGGQQIARYVTEAAEEHVKLIQKQLEYKVDYKIEILVYTKLSDLKQTNIGSGIEELNTGGQTTIIGNKFFVYFDGNHQTLTEQIRKGVAGVFINDMLFGGNVQEVLQNAVLLNIPDWFLNGLLAYIGSGWNAELDNKLRNGILSGRFRKFVKLERKEADFAGHAIWYYLATRYGEAAVPNLLYLTRINRSLESGFLFVIGKTFNQTIDEWYRFNYDRISKDEKTRNVNHIDDEVYVKFRNKRTYDQFITNKDSKLAAVVERYQGKHRVFIMDLETGKRKRVLTEGYRLPELEVDYNDALIAWHPTKDLLSVIYYKRGKTYLLQYDYETGEKEVNTLTRFQKVLSLSYYDPVNLLISAFSKGQSDIFIYKPRSGKTNQLTNDHFDDLEPSVVEAGGKKGVMFSSNRDTTLLENTKMKELQDMSRFDLFFYEMLEDGEPEHLIRVSSTAKAKEASPTNFTEKHFTYLSDINGVNNRYTAYFDTVFSHFDTLVYYPDSTSTNPKKLDSIKAAGVQIDSIKYIKVYRDIAVSCPQTDYSYSVISQSVDQKNKFLFEFALEDGNYKVHRRKLQLLDRREAPVLRDTPYRIRQSAGKGPDKFMIPEVFLNREVVEESDIEPEEKKVFVKETNDSEEDTVNYYFQSEFMSPAEEMGLGVFEDDQIKQKSEVKESKDEDEDPVYKRSRVVPYRVKFSMEEIVTQVDNRILFDEYQNLKTGAPTNTYPSLSPLFETSLSDLMEDFRLQGGFRVPFGFDGSEYYLKLNLLKNKIDHNFSYYRKTKRADAGGFAMKEKNTVFIYSTTLPIDVYRSFRGHFLFRNDRIDTLITDKSTAEAASYYENWAAYKLEYVYDNTIPVMNNILSGTRYKIFLDLRKEFEVPFLNEVKKETGWFSVFGFDIRHYQTIHKEITFASRLTGATSFGPNKVVYLLGGVDSWYGTRYFDQDTKMPQHPQYGYSAYATNLRGFRRNVRNGNSMMILNNELRVPIFSYLFNKPIRSKFIENFQVIGFYDIGTAWEGISPYDEDNPFNTKVIRNGPIKITVNYFRNPVVSGQGFGFRSLVFGYFMRLDFGWGKADGLRLEPITYFSISKDF